MYIRLFSLLLAVVSPHHAEDIALAEKHTRELCEIIVPTLRLYHHRLATHAVEKLLSVVSRNAAFVRTLLTRLVRISDRYLQFPTQYASEALQIFRWQCIILLSCPEAKDAALISSLLQSQSAIASLLVQRRPQDVAEIFHKLRPIFARDAALYTAYADALLSSVSANNIALVAAASACIKADSAALKVHNFELRNLTYLLAAFP